MHNASSTPFLCRGGEYWHPPRPILAVVARHSPPISGIIGAAAHVVDSIASPPSGCMGLFLRFLRALHPRISTGRSRKAFSGDHCKRRSYRPRQQPKKNTALAALIAFRENCASNEPTIVGVVMHGLDMVAPVSGAENSRVAGGSKISLLPRRSSPPSTLLAARPRSRHRKKLLRSTPASEPTRCLRKTEIIQRMRS